MYKLNFEKIKQSTTDFKGKDWFKPDKDLKGVWWNEEEEGFLEEEGFFNSLKKYLANERNPHLSDNDNKLYYKDLIPENKYKHPPIVCIYEGIRDHMTQILFILKENFTDKELGFTGWKSFSKEYLTSLCKGEYDIYNDWEDGDKFVFQFPEKINYFLESYCDKV